MGLVVRRLGLVVAFTALLAGSLLHGGCGNDSPSKMDGGTDAMAAGGDSFVQMVCGGAGGMSCPMGMFCELAVGHCGENIPGICRVIPGTCSKELNPVCGCDDMTYDNDCMRQMASMSASQPGHCP